MNSESRLWNLESGIEYSGHNSKNMNFELFEKKTGIVFKNKDLLKQAFIHRSYLNENKTSKLEHNERLEFLGDAVLELIVTEYLYEKFPKEDEGVLTSYRSALVNAVTLSKIASDLGMNDFLLLSKGEAKDQGRARQYILANTFESFVGAIFLDQGYEGAFKFIDSFLIKDTDRIIKEGKTADAKSLFQEKAQDVVGITPLYKTLKEEGPDHDKHFTVGVFLGAEKIAVGEGKSKQEAEQDAARNGLLARSWK